MIQGHLRRFPRFDELTTDDVRILERSFAAQRFRKGQSVVREGDRARGGTACAWLILEGQASLEIGGKAQRVLGAGELFGLVALLRDIRRTASVQVTRPAQVATIDRRTLGRLEEDHPDTWGRFQEVIALQLASDFRAVHQRLGQVLE